MESYKVILAQVKDMQQHFDGLNLDNLSDWDLEEVRSQLATLSSITATLSNNTSEITAEEMSDILSISSKVQARMSEIIRQKC